MAEVQLAAIIQRVLASEQRAREAEQRARDAEEKALIMERAMKYYKGRCAEHNNTIFDIQTLALMAENRAEFIRATSTNTVQTTTLEIRENMVEIEALCEHLIEEVPVISQFEH